MSERREQDRSPYRVEYIGGDREMGPWGRPPKESELDWRRRLAAEQEALCNRMAAEGYRLDMVQEALSAGDLKGSWTEGLWLYFIAVDEHEHEHA